MAEAAKNAKKSEPLPETDPSFHVYSEFDEANPGFEGLIAKVRVFDRLVLKNKLESIAQFDQDLGDRLENLFKTTPLSRRIIGDLREEVERDLKKAFHNSSVYGGLIG